jgi:hypothetical protein
VKTILARLHGAFRREGRDFLSSLSRRRYRTKFTACISLSSKMQQLGVSIATLVASLPLNAV